MGIFSRMLKMGEAETHSLLDKFEDPIKMIDQGIRDLKKDLAQAIKSLAEVKAIAIRHGRRPRRGRDRRRVRDRTAG